MLTGGDSELAAPPPDWAAQMRQFWFDDHGPSDWFGGGPIFDQAVGDLARDWHGALRDLPAEAFLTDPSTALAALILFDQVPRNLYRGHADAFATDPLARAIARAVLDKGWDKDWPEIHRQFAYMPFEHSEDLDDQRLSLRLMGQLADPAALEYARKHFDIIKEFGRFPHRNAALGRATRSEEAEAVEMGKNW